MNKIAKYVDQLKPSLAGRFIYYCLPWRKRLVLQNMKQAFGEKLTEKQRQKLAQAFYGHLARSVKEMLQMRFMKEKQLMSKVDVVGWEHLAEVAENGRGMLILTGHFGSWEFAPIAGILNFKKFQGKFHFIRKTLGAKWLEKILFRNYYKAGLHVIPKKNSLNQVRDALDANHAVVFVMDQHAIVSNRDGIEVEFFGKKAGTYRSLASFSRYADIPVVPASAYRLEDNRHVLHFHPPIPWEEQETSQKSIYHNTLKYNQTLEKFIESHPEQWLWLHKRWKLKECKSTSKVEAPGISSYE